MTTVQSNPSLLAQPLRLQNGTLIHNRLAKSAMAEGLGTHDNRPREALVTLYRRWAEGGLGLCITGNVMVDRRMLGEPNNVVIDDERDLAMLERWAEAGTRGGTQLWMQLNHPGKQAPKGSNRESWAPSAIPFREDLRPFFAPTRAMTETEIEETIQRFGRSAAIAKKAGFTGVQIHGAHGYLVSQFLSPHHNQRTDRWGGTPENRRRFVLSVLQAIRSEVGSGFPIGIKLNSADFQRGGLTEDEALGTVQALAAGGIDLIEISGGTYEAPAMMTGVQKESTRQREAYFLVFAEMARKAVETPIMLTGGFRTPGAMQAAIASGAVDVVGLARLLAIEPELPARLLQGHSPRHAIEPISTGLRFLDERGLMETVWYQRQLHRIGAGREPRPGEHGLKALLAMSFKGGWTVLRAGRYRA